VGTSLHLAAELFNMMTGTKMIHVPYRGAAPALTDLLAGQVQVLFDNLFTSLEHIKAGKLRALGVATAARVQQLPDLPTVADAVPGYEASSVFGVGVPTGTPREITELLNRELDAALADPRIRGRLLELTAIPIPSLAAEFRAEMVATTEKWGRVIRVANIKPE
jgi:tripartite-type tricarboxylate transporter receptor subunit TctC